MPYTPDPARVRELAERLIVHRATGPDTAADALGYDSTIPENESLSDGDWGVLMAAVDEAAKGAKISVSFPPTVDAPPKVGDLVHIFIVGDDSSGCMPMRVDTVVRTQDDLWTGRLVMSPVPDQPPAPFYIDWKSYQSSTNDETASKPGSWHWPCGTAEQGAEAAPTPDAPGSITVNITVQGSVSSEQDLADAIRRALHRPPGQAPYAAFKR